MKANLAILTVVLVAVFTIGTAWLCYMRQRSNMKQDLHAVRMDIRRRRIETATKAAREVRIQEEARRERQPESTNKQSTAKTGKSRNKKKNKPKESQKSQSRSQGKNKEKGKQNVKDEEWGQVDDAIRPADADTPATTDTSRPGSPSGDEWEQSAASGTQPTWQPEQESNPQSSGDEMSSEWEGNTTDANTGTSEAATDGQSSNEPRTEWDYTSTEPSISEPSEEPSRPWSADDSDAFAQSNAGQSEASACSTDANAGYESEQSMEARDHPEDKARTFW